MLVMALAGIGLAQVAAWGRDWLLDRGVRPRTATAGSVALVLSWWCLVSFHVWTGAALTAHGYLRASVGAYDPFIGVSASGRPLLAYALVRSRALSAASVTNRLGGVARPGEDIFDPW